MINREVETEAGRFLDVLLENGYSVKEAIRLIRDVANELLEKWEKEDVSVGSNMKHTHNYSTHSGAD